jgi:predicted AlkP superfamily phosphohydrolase/phosphomutase
MKKVFAIVLDAADPDLIEKWADDGSLPNLKRLHERGAYGRLTSVAENLLESVPYTFFSGRNPASHGAQGYATWHAESMTFRPPGPDWLPLVPFWRSFPDNGPRSIVLDVSNIYPLMPFNGIEIVGWASHDSLQPFGAYPPELAGQIDKKYGSGLLPDEFYGLLTRQEFLKDRDLIFDITRKFTALCAELMATERWEFFLAFTQALHHAGHRLWSTVNVTEPLTDEQQREMGAALRQAYIEADKMVGKLAESVGPETTLLVFSLHGMGVNRSRIWILPEMLRLILEKDTAKSQTNRLLEWLRGLVPARWRHEIKSRLPYAFRRNLTRFWRGGYDWQKTRAFALLSDSGGWIRVNLKGREAQGIVEPKDYEAILQEISQGLQSFVDEDTGQPVVKDVLRTSQLLSGENLHRLPDLIVPWADTPACAHRAVVSPKFGRVAWPTPGSNPEGRSGNHNPYGFLLACGPDIAPGPVTGADILDLAPTILTLLGQPIPGEMEGKVIQFPARDKSANPGQDFA